ncbi:MAG: pirin family protein [Bryobacteraceae bacterium]|nr:pirin family protein [Bryobacteraceae bacterium]
MMTYRSLQDLVPATHTTEGDGVRIRRAFPNARMEDLDPFLLFDHLGPLEFAPGGSLGFPEHPHRGFETISYLLQGSLQHKDSFGHAGLLGPGDVQWMTAGSGLVHSEMPGPDLAQNGGIVEGFQIWVNLPKQSKMVPPRYQELKAAEIPKAVSDDKLVESSVVAGESYGVKGAVQTHSPILYLHLKLKPGATVEQSVPSSQNAMAYVVRGQIEVAGRRAPEGSLAIFNHDADSVRMGNTGVEDAEVLLLAGEPLHEPVARYGPFVMNSREELVEAFEDYRSGKMGVIAG